MKYLFIDNFRGFTNACIPITDVNFLVGQNSTGKTSLLGLLKLFSSPHFIFDQDFADEYVSFGTFSDMASAHSADRSYFHVGMAFDKLNKKKDTKSAIGWLFTFIEDNGIPRLTKYTYYNGVKCISLRFNGNVVSYKKDECPSPLIARDIAGTMFQQWKAEHTSGNKAGYERLSVPAGFRGRIPLLLALSLTWQENGTSTAKKKSRSAQRTEILFDAPVDVAFASDLAWIAPIRTKPKAYYGDLPLDFDPEGEHTPYLIRKILRSKSDAKEFHAFMAKVGLASGLFQDVQIRNFPKRGATGPFEIDIVLDNEALKLTTVGYGVSQALPVLVEILARTKDSWLAIQQPEVHLHPRAQAALGDVIFEAAITEGKHFLIETHSDFAIDRFRMNYKRRKGKTVPDSQILFFERKEKRNVVTPLKIDESGELPSDQPDSYREFFIKEEMKILGL